MDEQHEVPEDIQQEWHRARMTIRRHVVKDVVVRGLSEVSAAVIWHVDLATVKEWVAEDGHLYEEEAAANAPKVEQQAKDAAERYQPAKLSWLDGQ